MRSTYKKNPKIIQGLVYKTKGTRDMMDITPSLLQYTARLVSYRYYFNIYMYKMLK